MGPAALSHAVLVSSDPQGSGRPSRPGQWDVLRCSGRVVVNNQVSGLRAGIRRTEGHSNLAARSGLQSLDARSFDSERGIGRLTGDSYINFGILGAFVL